MKISGRNGLKLHFRSGCFAHRVLLLRTESDYFTYNNLERAIFLINLVLLCGTKNTKFMTNKHRDRLGFEHMPYRLLVERTTTTLYRPG